MTAADLPDHSQTGVDTPQATLANVLAHMSSDAALEEPRRKKYAGGIRTACSILSRPPEAVPARLPSIETLLRSVPPTVHGRSRKTMANLRSTLKAALLRYAGGPRLPARGAPLQAEWEQLGHRLTELRLRSGLSSLMRLASHLGISPADVSEDQLRRITTLARASKGERAAQHLERVAPRLWNEAVDSIPEWPQIRLPEVMSRTRPSHLPLSAFPTSFQIDVDAYLAWAAGGDFLGEGPLKPLKPSTLRLRRDQLRIAASTLAATLGVQEIGSLATLVLPDHARRILAAYAPSRDGEKSSAFVQGLAKTLKTVARQWVKVPDDQVKQFGHWQRRLGRESSGLTSKNRTVLRQFEDPRVLDALLQLPDKLRRQAHGPRLSPGRRLLAVRTALAIDILLVAPMRLQNLTALRLDRQLQWPSGRSGTLYVVLNEDETKNEQPLEYPLPDRVRDAVHDYLDRFHRRADACPHPWLFVNLEGKRVPPGTLRHGISKAIERELGISMTPHQFRHLAAKIALDAQPGALGLVKDLLGHKNIKTTHGFYAGMRTREAARAYDNILAARRPVESGPR